jgi:penicillin amidase
VNWRVVRLVPPAAVLIALAGLSAFPPAPLPSPGSFLDPVHGIWSVAHQAELPARSSARIPGLGARVDVRYDDRGVPHIFAASEADAVRALGYVVARDRLFQLELQSRAGDGRLTELVGAAALPLDRDIRALGLPDAVDRRMAVLTPYERRLLTAFSDGVNAWIAQLGPRDIPLEYHLLRQRPARWEPQNSLHLLSRMGWTLALSDLERIKARAARRVGAAAADALYPVASPIQEPIQPDGRSAPRFARVRLPGPQSEAGERRSSGAAERGSSVASAQESTGAAMASGTTSRIGPVLCSAPRLRCSPAPLVGLPDDRQAEALGSNNWAVSPRRTRAGFALLAGDQHLEMTLPAIWYEAHLAVADSLDVYGVTIPGAPAIVIGFTRALAWTVTNTEADVLDRYREVVDDTLHPTRYRVDGGWRDLRLRVETYRGARGEVLATDTLRFTEHGPLSRDFENGGWQSLRWTVLESGRELTLFGRAARAGTAAAWLDSMAGYQAPAQNMLVADRRGTVAIRSTGRFPIRPSGRGDLFQRGDTSASAWSGDWPLAELPQATDPAQGFLASANQQPIDPEVDPRYLGANWYPPWRAIRINQLLRADSAVTPDAMRRWQTDPGSPAADLLAPAFLRAARRYPGRDSLQLAARLLAQWDRRYTRENTGAVLYDAAVRQLQRLLWDELRPDRGLGPPSLAMTVALLADSASPWWDDRRTAVVEDRDAILAEALERALGECIRLHGPPDGGGWRWDRVRQANIYHLLGIPALSALGIPVQGGPSTLNPSSGRGSFGPSWRMVVELGPEVHGWGTYPGGQSGNPASSRYTDRLGAWRDGALDSLRFPRSPAELEPRVKSILTLEPEVR